MKTDRLLALTVYLLNRDTVSARELAQRFEVSKRTIQRDMEVLNLSGIPIVSTAGTKGGYAILDTFRMERQAAGDSDYGVILTALKGLLTAFASPYVAAALEKVQAVAGGKAQPSLFLDFGVLREEEGMNARLRLLNTAIAARRKVEFSYTNGQGGASCRVVEPIALSYRWYGWYLLAYCEEKSDYRLFKLLRMENLRDTGEPMTAQHRPAEELLKECEQRDIRPAITFTLRLKPEAKAVALEYLHGQLLEQEESGTYLMRVTVPKEEHLWLGTLLSLGSKAEVVEPEEVRRMLRDKAEEIISLYSK